MIHVRLLVLMLMMCVAYCFSAFPTVPLDAQENARTSKTAGGGKLRESLLGAWALAGSPDSKHNPAPGARMKFWGLKHWVITQSDPQTGELVFHHGGTYTLDGEDYAETIKFAAEGTKDMIGMTLKFKITVDGDTYTQIGVGNSFNERWVRLKHK